MLIKIRTLPIFKVYIINTIRLRFKVNKNNNQIKYNGKLR